jgi:hypothetical protein
MGQTYKIRREIQSPLNPPKGDLMQTASSLNPSEGGTFNALEHYYFTNFKTPTSLLFKGNKINPVCKQCCIGIINTPMRVA